MSDRFVTSSPGIFITRVQATDGAGSSPIDFTYSLGPDVNAGPQHQTDKNWFQINRTSGVITATKTLDREVIKLLHHDLKQFTATLLLLLNTKREFKRAHLLILLFQHACTLARKARES